MPDTSETRGLLAKNSEIRNEMMKRKDFSSNDFFLIQGKEEYQDTFTPNNKLEDTAGLRFTNAMSLNAYLNKGRFLDDKYITPSLTDFYGSNPQISGNIGYFNIYTARNGSFDMEDGRIVDDYGSEVKFIRAEGNDLKDKEFYFLRRNLKLAEKLEYERISDNEEDKVLNQRYYSASWVQETDEAMKSSLFDEEFYGFESPKDIDSVPRPQKNPTRTVESVLHQLTSATINDTERVSNKTILNVTQSLFEVNRIKTPENTKSKTLTNKKGEYSRSWSRYKQYSNSLKNLTGNYKDDEGNPLSISEIQRDYHTFRAGDTAESLDYLANNTVLENTGFVNIVRGRTDNKGNIKKCMFSIENLAWKDVPDGLNYLSDEQRGPNGGRIMWFPPYDLDFQESINANWEQNQFIGRGEKVYTYTNTDRTGSLSFTLLIDHPNILNAVDKESITEEDVLRFFNGEQLLKNKTKMEYLEEDKPDNSTPDIEQVPEDNNKQLKFTLYFPYNYSGMYMYNENNLNIATFTRDYSDVLDDDWWIYLMIGNGTEIKCWNKNDGWDGTAVYPDEWRGYEISPLYSLGNYNNKVYPIADNKNIKPWHYVSEDETDSQSGANGYCQRIDYDMKVKHENGNSYKDDNTLMLNNYLVSTGETDENLSNRVDYSSAEAMVAIVRRKDEDTGDTIQKFSKLEEYIVANSASSDRITEIEENINNLPITKVEITGYAGTDEGLGLPDCLNTLSLRRAYAVKSFIEDYLGDKITEDKITLKIGSTKTESSIESKKKARRAEITITFDTTNITTLSDTATGTRSDEENINITDNVGIDAKAAAETPESDIQNGKKIVAQRVNSQRYENEADYFERISDSSSEVDKMICSKIVDKIKYFNPAFHSMSPEGFNARLTFLHQCTRQGHTIEVSDKNGFASTAGNLAFGKMPVCVLTLGDFINSRVIISSMTISYSEDGMQWDLNKTGSGVQPMFAKVSLNLVIIGGQSLGGPVSRLQNAVTFNYYANAGVYDDRADRVSLGGAGNKTTETYEKIWTPYPQETKPEQKVE